MKKKDVRVVSKKRGTAGHSARIPAGPEKPVNGNGAPVPQRKAAPHRAGPRQVPIQEQPERQKAPPKSPATPPKSRVTPPRRTEPIDVTDVDLLAKGPDVAKLHAALTAAGLKLSARELDANEYGPSTRDAVASLQRDAGLPVTGRLDERTGAALRSRMAAMASDRYRIEGRLKTADGLAASKVDVTAWRIELGGKAEMVGQGTSDEQGFFVIEYAHEAESPPMVQLRAVKNQQEHPLTDWAPQPVRRLVLDLVVPGGFENLADEHSRLRDSLRDVSLAELEENRERKDLSLLHESTGWDPRLIALASTAASLGKSTGVPEHALYGLLRSGLPSDPALLAATPPKVVKETLERAADAGVITMSRAELGKATAAFEGFATRERLSARAPGAVSSMGELLAVAPVREADRPKLEALYAKHAHDAKAFWTAVREELPRAAGTLEGVGKLAYLTASNAPLVSALLADSSIDVKKPATLVDAGYHQPDRWTEHLDRLADGDDERLAKLIPETYTGGTPKARRDAYAEDLARAVRLGFPMRTLRMQVANGELKLVGRDGARVAKVLEAAEAAGVDIAGNSKQRLSQFLHEKGDELFRGVRAETRKEIESKIRTLQRLYQITPSDHGLKALDKLGFRSAHDVVAFDRNAFLERYGKYFLPGEAELVYRKAEQGVATVYNAFVAARQIPTSGEVPAIGPGVEKADAARTEVQKKLGQSLPTLESLFGSMDFCACEHCRSVLGPAAYFVDLLKFLDPDDLVWEARKAAYEQRHGRPYPGKKPYEELADRRPDLPHLPLTCENTSTELPYIDVVNEILEYYVANDQELGPDAVRDTGSLLSADLIAEPQHIIPEAYDVLRDERFPLNAPFDLHLERVRAFMEALEVKWHEVLDALRPTEDLASTLKVALEAAGFGPHERKPFTEHGESEWYELYGYESAAEAAELFRGEHALAKPVARRLGVSYQELVQLLRTRYVNPKLESLVYLRKAGLTEDEVFRWKAPAGDPNAFTAAEAQAFADRLAALKKQFPSFDEKKLEKAWAAGTFKQVAVLSDTSGRCNFDDTVIRFAEGDGDVIGVLYRLNVLARLSRKLGWTFDEVDQLLAAFPFENETDLDELWTARLACASYVEQLHQRTGLSREDILTFWSDIPTTSTWSPLTPSVGARSLYERVFLAPSILETDRVFDDALGQYLQDDKAKLGQHLPAVQAAVGLSAQDIGLLVADPDAEGLTLPLVSMLYRHAALARGLGVSIRELLTLKRLSGIDPFETPGDEAPATLDELRPYGGTVRFVELAEAVRDGGLSYAELDYLAAHRFDAIGEFAEAERVPESLVRSLVEQLAQVESDLQFPEGELTAELLRPKLSLLLPAEAVDRFLGAWSGTRQFDARTSQKLEAKDFATEERFSVAYDLVADEYHLRYRGVVTPAIAKELEKTFQSNLQKQLIDELAKQAKALADEHPTLIDAAGLDVLFPDTRELTDLQRKKAEEKRRDALLEKLVPLLRDSLRRRAVVRAVAASLDANEALVDALVDDATVLEEPGSAGASLRGAFEAALERGITATFMDAGGKKLKAERLDAVELKPADLPAGTKTVRLEGWFDVPATTGLRFIAELKGAAAKATLSLDGEDVAAPAGKTEWPVEEVSAGPLHRLVVEVVPAGGRFSFEVVGDAVPRAPLAKAFTFLPGDSVERIRRARSILGKAMRLATGWQLEPVELPVLFANALDGTRSPLPLPVEAPEKPEDAEPVFHRIMRMARYVKLRDELGISPAGLVGVLAAGTKDELLEAAKVAFPEDAAAFEEAVGHFGVAAPISVRLLERVVQALQLSRKLRLSFADLKAWTSSDVDFETARAVRDTVKTRFSEVQWRQFARPIYDRLRKRQRDALVAHVLQQKKLERVDELFEHFLLDPGTEPVVLTSRMQLAISSVQTFIQRCFLNLEPRVPPAALEAKHWQWMRRYRVWEASRKILLFPENWLEPEWRHDASHLYTDLVSSLLQGDVSDEAVEKAFFDYLRGLEEIARLEIVSTWYEASPDPANSALHVLGRTYGNPHKYFYRRYAQRRWAPWVPVKADIDGDHVVLAKWRHRIHIFWVTFMEKRDEPGGGTGKSTPETLATSETVDTLKGQRQVRLQLSWLEYFQGKWINQKSTGFYDPVNVAEDFDPRRVRIHVAPEGPDGLGLAVRLSSPPAESSKSWTRYATTLANAGLFSATATSEIATLALTSSAPMATSSASLALDPDFNVTFHVLSKHAAVELEEWAPGPPYFPVSFTSGSARTPTGIEGSGQLQVYFTQKTTTDDEGATTVEQGNRTILGSVGGASVVPTANEVRVYEKDFGGLLIPFFLQDKHHTFYVEPNVVETPIEEWETKVVFVPPRLEKVPDFEIRPQKPGKLPPVIDKRQPYINPVRDWLIQPGTEVLFKNVRVGSPSSLLAQPAAGEAVEVLGGAGAGTRVRVERGPVR